MSVGEGKVTMEDVIREETLKYKKAHDFILRHKEKVREVYAKHFLPWFDKNGRRSSLIEVGTRCGSCKADNLQFHDKCTLICGSCGGKVHIPPVGEVLISHGCKLINLRSAKKRVLEHPYCKLCNYGLTIIPFGQVGRQRKAHIVCPYCYTISLRNVQVLEKALVGHKVRKRMYAPKDYQKLKKTVLHGREKFWEPEIVDRPQHLERERGTYVPTKNVRALVESKKLKVSNLEL